jgi:serine/threonine protein kinase
MSNDSNNAFGDNPTEPFGPGDGPASMLGRYRLLRELGRGGFGTVWLAEERGQVTRRVAIKILTDPLSSREVLARFQQEIQAQAMMNHPGIAKVLAADRAPDGRPYYVMEYIKGLPITTFCDQKELSIKDRLVLFRRVCDAVQHAHMKGVIHRDIKPSNVMAGLVEDAERFESIEQVFVRVIDFGVAKAINRPLIDATIATADFQMIGTAGYMSPEQASPDAMGIDTRADVYSLGVMLYELLVGARPFTNDQLKNAMWKGIHKFLQETEPPPPSTRLSNLRTASDDEGQNSATIARARGCALDVLVEELRRELEWIPLHAMAKLPEDRYRSPADLADDIARYLEGKPLRAGPRTLWYHARKIARLYRPQVAVALTILTLLIAGAAGVTWQWREAESARAREARERQAAEREAYRSLLIGINGELVSRSFWYARSLVDGAARHRGNWEFDLLASLTPALERHAPPDPIVAMAARGDRIRAIGALQNFWLSPTNFNEVAPPDAGIARTIALSPDAKFILAYRLRPGTPAWILLDSDATIADARVLQGPAPAGRLLGAVSLDGSRAALGTHGQSPLLITSTSDSTSIQLDVPAAACDFTPDASELILADATLSRYSTTTGRRTGELLPNRQATPGRLLRFSPSRDAVLIIDAAQAQLWELATARNVWTRPGNFVAAAFSPDGASVLLATPSEVHLIPAASGTRSRVLPFDFTILAVGFTPDGSRAWVSGNSINRNSLVLFPPPDPRPLFVGPPDAVLRGSTASPLLAVESEQKRTVDLIDTRSGVAMAQLVNTLGPTSFDRNGDVWVTSALGDQPILIHRSAAGEATEPAPPSLKVAPDQPLRVGLALGDAAIFLAASTQTEVSVHKRTSAGWAVLGSWPLAPGADPARRKPEEFVRPAMVRAADRDAMVAVAAETGVYLLDSSGAQRSFVPAEAVPEFIEFEPASTTLAIACAGGDVFLATERSITQLQKADGRPTDVQIRGIFWIEPGKLAIVESSQVVVWDTATASELARITIPPTQSATIAGSERRLISADVHATVDIIGRR